MKTTRQYRMTPEELERLLAGTQAASAAEPTVPVSPPPDTLGGVTIGSVLERKRFKCDQQSCDRDFALAGVSGLLTVMLCDRRVQSVMWVARWVYSTPATEELGKYQKSIHPSLLPHEEAKASNEILDGLMRDKGWAHVAEPSARFILGIPTLLTQLTNKHGNLRTMLLSAETGLFSSIGYAGQSWTLNVSAAAPVPCTVGL